MNPETERKLYFPDFSRSDFSVVVFFFWKQILTCLHLLWAMMAKGSKGEITSFDPSWVQLSVYTVSVHQTLFCSFLEPSKIKSNPRKHATSTLFSSG